MGLVFFHNKNDSLKNILKPKPENKIELLEDMNNNNTANVNNNNNEKLKFKHKKHKHLPKEGVNILNKIKSSLNNK